MRAKMDTFNNESRMKYALAGIKPVDFVAESKCILKSIRVRYGL